MTAAVPLLAGVTAADSETLPPVMPVTMPSSVGRSTVTTSVRGWPLSPLLATPSKVWPKTSVVSVVALGSACPWASSSCADACTPAGRYTLATRTSPPSGSRVSRAGWVGSALTLTSRWVVSGGLGAGAAAASRVALPDADATATPWGTAAAVFAGDAAAGVRFSQPAPSRCWIHGLSGPSNGYNQATRLDVGQGVDRIWVWLALKTSRAYCTPSLSPAVRAKALETQTAVSPPRSSQPSRRAVLLHLKWRNPVQSPATFQ